MRDELDDYVMPIGMTWFYTADDAANAIEMMDSVFPDIKAAQPATTLMYEYGLMRAYRRTFARVYQTLGKIKTICQEARDFDDNPGEAVISQLELLRVSVSEARDIG